MGSRKVVGYTTGVFDMFHIGHLNILRNARERCDRLVVGVTADDLAAARKGKVPVVPCAERMEIVRSVRYVDDVVVQQTMDKMAAWKELRFDVMFVGDDWQGNPTWERLEKKFAAKSVQIVYLPYTVQTSSTLLRKHLLAR